MWNAAAAPCSYQQRLAAISSALQLSAAQGSCHGRMLMMNELAAELDDRSILEESHYAYTAIQSAYHQAFVPMVKQGTPAY